MIGSDRASRSQGYRWGPHRRRGLFGRLGRSRSVKLSNMQEHISDWAFVASSEPWLVVGNRDRRRCPHSGGRTTDHRRLPLALSSSSPACHQPVLANGGGRPGAPVLMAPLSNDSLTKTLAFVSDNWQDGVG